MAKKWHVKANGDMGVCSAEQIEGPLKSEGAVHFSDAQDALAYSEQLHEAQFGLFPDSADLTEYIDRDEFYEELRGYEDLEDRMGPGDHMIFRSDLYKIKAIRRGDDGETIVDVVDVDAGEFRELSIYSYNRSEIRLRGDGPLDPTDPSSYDVEWDVSSYMGSYISPGDSFLYEGRIYRADDWEWSRPLLRTEIEATDESTGETETLIIHQGSESDVKFLKGTKDAY